MNILVIGYKGEVGSAIFKLAQKKYGKTVVGLDKDGYSPNYVPCGFNVIHVCVPTAKVLDVMATNKLDRWSNTTSLVIIDSTISMDMVTKIGPAAYSPTRGKHPNIFNDLKKYPKWVASGQKDMQNAAVRYYRSLGLKVKVAENVATLVLAKLLETSYYGWLIAFAQESHRLCDYYDANFDQAYTEWNKEKSKYWPAPVMYPGIIGGHCVIPNAKLLGGDIGNFIVKSNKLRASLGK